MKGTHLRLVEDAALVEGAPLRDLPAIIGHLETLKAVAFARLVGGQGEAASEAAPDAVLTVAEVAEDLQKSPDWVYTHAKALPFAYRIGRQWRFSRRGLEKFKEAKCVETDGNSGAGMSGGSPTTLRVLTGGRRSIASPQGPSARPTAS